MGKDGPEMRLRREYATRTVMSREAASSSLSFLWLWPSLRCLRESIMREAKYSTATR